MGDLNDDGREDLAVLQPSVDTVSVLLGAGDGTFQPASPVGVGRYPEALAIGDLNADAHRDLVVIHATAAGGTIFQPSDAAILLGRGDGTFQEVQRPSVGRLPSACTLGDFTGDGVLDLVVANFLDGTLSLLPGRGDGTLAPLQVVPLPPSPLSAISPRAIAAGDLNQDGRLDLAVANFGNNTVSVLLGAGDGTFQFAPTVVIGPGPRHNLGLSGVLITDLNHDGRFDVAVAHSGDDSVSVLVGQGPGTFQRPRRFGAGRVPVGLATGEFNDRQGDPDQVFTGLPGDFSRLVRHPDGTAERILTSGTRVLFDAQGRHTATVDRNGLTTRYVSDEQGRLSRVEFPGEASFRLDYNPLNGHLASVTDSAGRTTQVLINGDGNLRRITQPDGTTRSFAYDAEHHLTSQTDARGFTTDYRYDAFGRVTETILPERPVVDPATGTITPQREVRRFTPSEVQGLINTLPEGVGTPTNPAPALRPPPAIFEDGAGHPMRLLTDHFGAPTQLTDALGRVTTVERDVNGLPVKVTRANGALVVMRYDARGNVTLIGQQVTRPNTPFPQPIAFQFAYEPRVSQLTKLIVARRDSLLDFNHPCPEGCTTRIEHDDQGNPIRIIDHLGNVTSFTYDSRGLLLTSTDALGNLTPDIPDDQQVRFTYDPATGNLTATTDQLSRTTGLGYDTVGNVATSTDAEGRTTSFAYDAMNRLRAVLDAASGTTSYAYDAAGNLTSVTDARRDAICPTGCTTRFAYDAVDLLASVTNPLGQAKAFAYDAVRNLARLTDARQQTRTFRYDAASQLTSKVLTDATGTVTDTVTYAYDLLGSLALVQDSDSKLAFTYDSAGRLATATTGEAGTPALAQPAATLIYSYDPNGNRLSLTCTTDACLSVEYTYDGLNRLIGANARNLVGKNLAYDPLSRLTRLSGGAGAQSAFTYDAASQLTGLEQRLTATPKAPPIETFTYTYDPRGNRLTRTDRFGQHAYGYDALSRLTQATHPVPSGLPAEAFTYDPVGNRTTSHLSATHDHDAANRLLEDAQFTYTYDATGNRTTKTATAAPAQVEIFTYDGEDQLIGYTTAQAPTTGGPVTATYRYDGLGRRIEKVVNGVVTRFVYDQEDVVGIFSGETNCHTHAFLHGPGIDQPLALLRDTNADCRPLVDAVGFGEPIIELLADGLGSITALTTQVGGFFRSTLLAERITYDSFGTPTLTGPGPDRVMDTGDDVVLACSAFGNPYLFTGREYDCESGLYYYGRRYYDPTAGRFLQEDPLAGDDVHPQQRYLYAEGNPVNLVDPGGRQAQAAAVGLAAVCTTSIAGVLVCTAIGLAAGHILAEAGKAVVQTVAAAAASICRRAQAGAEEEFPDNPDDWVPPEGVKEEAKTTEATGGKHRQWKDSSGKVVRRWDRGEPGKPGWRGRDHWNDAEGHHIAPGSK